MCDLMFDVIIDHKITQLEITAVLCFSPVATSVETISRKLSACTILLVTHFEEKDVEDNKLFIYCLLQYLITKIVTEESNISTSSTYFFLSYILRVHLLVFLFNNLP